MKDLDNCKERYQKKFEKDPFENELPTVHFAEIICMELRKRELEVIQNSLSVQYITHMNQLNKIKNILEEEDDAKKKNRP